MATGRTVLKHCRFYADGYDLSGYTRSFGPLAVTHDEDPHATLTDGVLGTLPGHALISVGTLNGVFDNTATSGLHVALSSAGAMRTVMAPIGIRADPANGDPVFMGQFEQTDYQAELDGATANVSLPFNSWSSRASSLLYRKPWGVLLHAKGAETAVNTAVGIDDAGAASTAGGYMVYQIFAGDGTATVKVQHAATNSNPSFSDLSGATSGSVDCTTPSAGLVALGVTASVSRYLRWQIVLGTATTVTFALAFVRG